MRLPLTGHIVRPDGLIRPVPSMGINFVPGRYTSTDWDGDAKSGADGIIDLSAAFSLDVIAKAIYVRLGIMDETTNVYAFLGPDNNAGLAGIVLRTWVANMAIYTSGIVQCDGNGDIYFGQGGELDAVIIIILGYWI